MFSGKLRSLHCPPLSLSLSLSLCTLLCLVNLYTTSAALTGMDVLHILCAQLGKGSMHRNGDKTIEDTSSARSVNARVCDLLENPVISRLIRSVTSPLVLL